LPHRSLSTAQHRHQVCAGAGALDRLRIRDAGHVPFLERDPFHHVELDAELIGDQRTAPRPQWSSRRRGRRYGSRATSAGAIRRRSLSTRDAEEDCG
jgi:hypothetical protein